MGVFFFFTTTIDHWVIGWFLGLKLFLRSSHWFNLLRFVKQRVDINFLFSTIPSPLVVRKTNFLSDFNLLYIVKYIINANNVNYFLFFSFLFKSFSCAWVDSLNCDSFILLLYPVWSRTALNTIKHTEQNKKNKLIITSKVLAYVIKVLLACSFEFIFDLRWKYGFDFDFERFFFFPLKK